MRASLKTPRTAFSIATGLTLVVTPIAGGPMPVEKFTAIGPIPEAICTASTLICAANYTVEISMVPPTNFKISKTKPPK